MCSWPILANILASFQADVRGRYFAFLIVRADSLQIAWMGVESCGLLWNYRGMNKRPSTTNTSTNPSPVLPPRGLRIMDAANYMGLAPFYVEELVRSGELPALKLCQHYTILREDADAFLDRKREELECHPVLREVVGPVGTHQRRL